MVNERRGTNGQLGLDLHAGYIPQLTPANAQSDQVCATKREPEAAYAEPQTRPDPEARKVAKLPKATGPGGTYTRADLVGSEAVQMAMRVFGGNVIDVRY